MKRILEGEEEEKGRGARCGIFREKVSKCVFGRRKDVKLKVKKAEKSKTQKAF